MSTFDKSTIVTGCLYNILDKYYYENNNAQGYNNNTNSKKGNSSSTNSYNVNQANDNEVNSEILNKHKPPPPCMITGKDR